MKKIIAMVIVFIIVSMNIAPALADEADNLSTLQRNLAYSVSDGDLNALITRSNYSYMLLAPEIRSNVATQYLFQMTDLLINTGYEPDEQKYMDVLINIILTYDCNNATETRKQAEFDDLKDIKDYAFDAKDAAVDILTILSGNSALEKAISTAVDGISMIADADNEWIEALSDLDAVITDYSRYDYFLATIELNASGALSTAAAKLRTGLYNVVKLELEMYQDLSSDMLEDCTEFIISDVFIEMIKTTTEYQGDETVRFFVDKSDRFIQTVGILTASWDLGLLIGKTIGNIFAGGENLINRVLEILALYDISCVLQEQILDLSQDAVINHSDEHVEKFVNLSLMLIDCRVRGEYCNYSLIANDAGLLSWAQKENAEAALALYERQSTALLALEERIKAILDIENVEAAGKLVTDAYLDVIYDDQHFVEPYTYCFHIPQINLRGDRAENANKVIYNDLYAVLQENVYSGWAQEYMPFIYGMAYDWGMCNNVVSVVVSTHDQIEWTEYYVYNVSIETGDFLSDSDVVEAFGLTMDEYYDAVYATLVQYWDEHADEANYMGEEWYNQIRSRTLEYDNLVNTIPFVNSDGNLGFVAYIYSAAGAGRYLHLLSSIGEADWGYIECSVDHSDAIASKSDEGTKGQADIEDSNIIVPELVGNWIIDAEYTMDFNGVGMTNIFGTSYKYGNGMEFGSDGHFEYYIAAGFGGEGTYTVEDDAIRASVRGYETGMEYVEIMTLDKEGRIVMPFDVYTIFWMRE